MKLSHRVSRLPSLFLLICCTIDVILPNIANFFQILLMRAGYEQLTWGLSQSEIEIKMF